MPFTLSHAAAALPFRKLNPVCPALVIGTFAPDFQYFLWISDEDRSGHYFPAVAFITLPLALLLLWVFECCVKGPIIELLPSALQARLQDKLQPLSFRSWRRFASIVLWIAVGIATHLIWDSFTHGHNWMVERWGPLSFKLRLPFLYPMPINTLLQHVSTLLGLLVLAAWFLVWYRRTAPVAIRSVRELSGFRKLTVVSTMAITAVSAGFALAIFRLSDHEIPISHSLIVSTVIEAITLVFCVEVLLYGLARTYNSRSRRASAIRMDQQRS
jgi:hypothetical protein